MRNQPTTPATPATHDHSPHHFHHHNPHPPLFCSTNAQSQLKQQAKPQHEQDGPHENQQEEGEINQNRLQTLSQKVATHKHQPLPKWTQKQDSFTFNHNQMCRFDFLLWGNHKTLQNVVSYDRLFAEIRQQTGISSIKFNFDVKLPGMQKGALFQISDFSEAKKYQASQLLMSLLQEQDKHATTPAEATELTILVPRMLVPVMMGKEGRIINKIKKMTGCSIMVYGPHHGYYYQNIQISSPSVQAIAKTCFLIYNTVYKVLVRQPIIITAFNAKKLCSLGLLMTQEEYSNAICGYLALVEELKKQCKVEVELEKVVQRQHKKKETQKQIVFKIAGKLEDVKMFVSKDVTILGSILKILQFEGKKSRNLKLIVTNYQAKSIKSLSGRILRDISSKAEYCYIQVKDRDANYSSLVIKGSYEGQIKVAVLVCQFISYGPDIIQNESKKPLINYEEEIDKFDNPGSTEDRENYREVTKNKKIKKNKKLKGNKRKKSNSHNSNNLRKDSIQKSEDCQKMNMGSPQNTDHLIVY